MSAPTSIRLEDKLVDQLNQLATATDRPRSWHIERAIERYLADEAWQVAAIAEALADVEAGTADLVPHDAAMGEIEALLRRRQQ